MSMMIASTAALAVIMNGTNMILQNQQTQHAKGAEEAQNTLMNAQIAKQTAADKAAQQKQADTGSATQASALAALRASMSASAGMGGSILTGPSGAAPAPTSTKSLLGV